MLHPTRTICAVLACVLVLAIPTTAHAVVDGREFQHGQYVHRQFVHQWFTFARNSEVWWFMVLVNKNAAEAQTQVRTVQVGVHPPPVASAVHSCAIPAYICQRESGYDIHAQNPSSSASGKYQFLDSTWANFMGYARAKDAPEWVQDEKARQVWAETGGSAWACC